MSYGPNGRSNLEARMLALQALTTIAQPGNPTCHYIFMTALVDSGHVSPEELFLQQLPHHRSTLHIRAFGREPNALPILGNYLMPKKFWLPKTDSN